MINSKAYFYQVLFLLVITILLLGIVQACVIKIPRETRKWEWDRRHFKKQLNNSCECGKDAPDAGFKANETWSKRKTEFPWTVFIHVNHTNSKTHKTCVGTIIASDLVVTSHSCFLLKQKPKLRLHNILGYQYVNPETSRAAASIDHVKVTRTKVVINTTKIYNVTRIYFNPRYLESSEAEQYPENDLAVLKVEENLLNQINHVPICIPNYGDLVNPRNAHGTFFGYPQENHPKKSEKPYDHFGTIVGKEDCYRQHSIKPGAGEKGQASWKKTLCLLYFNPLWYLEGSPLVISSNGFKSQAFLMGVATKFTRNATKETNELEYLFNLDAVYASSIFPLVNFLEHIGIDSTWCKTPELELLQANETMNFTISQKPWTKVLGPIQRDEELDCVCGINNNQPSVRITGGVEAMPREFGWLAYLLIWTKGRGDTNFLSACGGAIVNDRVILTAAHCVVAVHKITPTTDLNTDVFGYPVEDIDVYLNNHDTFDVPNGQADKSAIKVALSRIQYNREFVNYAKADIKESDVAVLILKEPLVFAKGREPGIRPICLHKMGSYTKYTGKTATVAGWGLINPVNYTFPKKLQKREVEIKDLKDCKKVFTDFPHPGVKKSTLLCAGTFDRWNDPAPGDSGGPLISLNKKAGLWFQVGLVSFGTAKDENDPASPLATYYTDVQKVTSFVDYHSKREGAKWCANE